MWPSSIWASAPAPFIRTIRWVFRTPDRVQTVEKRHPNDGKTRCSLRLPPPHLRRRASPNYTPSAPELRLIATQVSDQIWDIKRRVALPGMQMSNSSVKFVPAVFAGILAGVSLATMTDLRAQTPAKEAASEQAKEAAADNCLSGPKGATPPGGHWRYRIDRATKRQCWYLKEGSDKAEGAKPGKSAGVTPEDSSAASAAATEPSPPQPRATTRKAITDARAEWISQQARAEQNAPANMQPQSAAAPPTQDSTRAALSNVFAPVPLATTRWTDPAHASSPDNSADPRTAVADPRAAAADPSTDQSQQPEETQQPAPASAAPASVEASIARPTASLQMLLIVMAAALALAGITVSLVFRFGRARARAVIRHNRNTMWDSAPRRSPPMMPARDSMMHARESVMQRRDEAVMRRPARAQEPRAPEAKDRQVKEMLARLARSAQA